MSSPKFIDLEGTAAATNPSPLSSPSISSSVSSEPFTDEEDDELLDEKRSLLAGAREKVDKDTAPVEYTVSSSRKMVYLLIYFGLNMGMTLSNKAVLQFAKFPWLLTTMHAAATSIGCAALFSTGRVRLSRLSLRDNIIMMLFSTLFTLNIAISNVSLSMVSVPFHQVLRSTCPIVTILIYRMVYARKYSRQTYMTMIPLVLGVALATYGDYDFTVLGFSLAFLGVVLAAVKSIASNRLMTGTLKLPALEILYRMSPLAAVQCLVYAYFSGELGRFHEVATSGTLLSSTFLSAIAGNALTAFVLNIASFETNKIAGALTISVCANVKQCLTIAAGVMAFGVHVGAANGAGMFITVLGAAWYSKVELDNRKANAVKERNEKEREQKV